MKDNKLSSLKLLLVLLFIDTCISLVNFAFLFTVFRQSNQNQAQLKGTVQTIDNHVDCIAGYFTMTNRTGDTTLNCK